MEAETIRYHQNLTIGVTTFVEIVGITAYACRLLARRLSASKLWYDDYVMGIGLVTASIPGICNYVGLRHGLGKHVYQVMEHDRERFLIGFYILQLAYVSTLPTVKIAVLLYYYRIFPQKRFRLAVYSMGVFLVLLLFSSWVGVLLQCLPVRGFWKPEIPHHCFDQVTFYMVNGSLNFVSDVLVVLMPIPLLWNLHVPITRVIIFLLAGFACSLSLFRIVSLKAVDPNDITWSNVAPGLWSAAEAEIVVMSANLPLMGPIVEYLRGKCRNSSDRTHEDEEHRSILELSAISSKKRLAHSKNQTSAGVQASTFTTTAEGSTQYGRENTGSKAPDNRIVVEMGLEQKFTGQSADSATYA